MWLQPANVEAHCADGSVQMRDFQMSKASSGFALVELVVIVVILAILAAFAVPRFSALEAEGRSAEVTALAGQLRSNIALAHALWLRGGQPLEVVLAGRTIAMTNGYPDQDSIHDTLSSLDGFSYDNSDSPGIFFRTTSGATKIEACTVSYAAAEAPSQAPTITVDTSGC